MRGFTLIEMLLSVGILAILAGLTLPVYMNFQASNELAATTHSLASMLRRAQVYSRSGNGDDRWGVEISAASAVLYKGDSFARRDSNRDEVLLLPATITLSGMRSVNFAKLSADPSTTGSITLATSTNSRTISVNAVGTIDY